MSPATIAHLRAARIPIMPDWPPNCLDVRYRDNDDMRWLAVEGFVWVPDLDDRATFCLVCGVARARGVRFLDMGHDGFWTILLAMSFDAWCAPEDQPRLIAALASALAATVVG